MKKTPLMIATLLPAALGWAVVSASTPPPAGGHDLAAEMAVEFATDLAMELASEAPAPVPEPPLAADAFQIRADLVYVGDGSDPVENGVVLIENGRIRRAGAGVEVDDSVPLIQHDGVLTAGIVACHSHAGTSGEDFDSARSLLPAGRIVYAFHPEHSDFDKAMRSGITSVVLAPTAQNLAGGQTCVVKTAGGRVLRKDAHLALSFTQEALTQGPQQMFFFFGAERSADRLALDDGLESTGSNRNGARYPTSYPGSIEALDAALAGGDGVFGRVSSGEMPVLLEAWDRNEVARAAGFAKRHGLRGAIRGAPLAGELGDLLRDSGLGVVIGPFDPGHPRRSLEGLAALTEAGVPLAFGLGGSENHPEQVRMTAAMAVGAGVDPAVAWQALSSQAARIAGVEDRVGRIEPGMDADLVLWSDDPLNLTSRVEAVFVDGVRVHGGAQ